MKKIIAILAFVLGLTSSWAQKSEKLNEEESVRAALTLFLDGWATGDSVKMGKAMHPSWQIKSYNSSSSKFNHKSRTKYLSSAKLHPREADVITEIVMVDIYKNIASAKTRITTSKNIFTDYVHLIKTNEGWFIVDKIATREDK